MVVLLAVLVAAILVVPGVVDWNQYRDEIAARGKATTGREIIIAGDIGMTLLPAPALVVRDVRVANVADASMPDMVRLKSLEVRVALMPLLAGDIRVETVKLVEPVIELEVLADGRRNWEFGPTGGEAVRPPPAAGAPSGKTAEVEAALPVRLDNFVILDGALTYRDARSGTVERISAIDARIQAASLVGPVESSGRLQFRGLPLSYQASLGEIIHERTVPFGLTIGVDSMGAEVQFSGTLVSLTADPKFKGKVKLAAKSLASAIRMGQGGSALPGLVGQSLTAQGEVTASAAGAEVSGLALALGDTQASGSVTVDLKKGVSVAAKLAVPHVNLDKWLAMTEIPTAAAPDVRAAVDARNDQGTPKGSIALVPPRPVPAAAAKDFALPSDVTASLALAVDAVTWRGDLVRLVRANVELADGDLTISQLAAQVPGSSDVAVFGVVSAAGGEPRFEGRIEASAADLRRVLAWLGVEAPKVPSDRLRKLVFSGDVKATPQEVQLPKVDLVIDGSRVTGGATVALRRRIAFGADLALDRLNLDSYLGEHDEATPANAPPATGAGPPSEATRPAAARGADAANPFAAIGALADFDANFRLKAGTITYNRAAIKNVAMEGTLFNGALEVRRATVEDLAGASASLSGTLSEISGLPAFKDARLSLRAANVERLVRLAGIDPPIAPEKLGAATVEGRIDGPLVKPMLEVQVQAAGGRLALNGTVPLLPLGVGLEARIRLAHPDLARLLSALEVDYRPVGPIGAVELAGVVKFEGTAVTLTELKGKIGATAVEGTVAVALAEPKPKVTADLSTGEIVLDHFLPASRAASRVPTEADARLIPAAWPGMPPAAASRHLAAAAKQGDGRWSTHPVDLTALGTINAQVALKSSALSYQGHVLRDADVAAALSDGVLTTQRLNGILFGGPLSGSVRLQATAIPAAQVALTARDMQMAQMLRASSGQGAVSGRAEVETRLTTTGRSVADMVAALAGDGKIAFRGVSTATAAGGSALAPLIEMIGVVNHLGATLGGRRGEGLADVTGSFRMERGVARSDDLRLASNVSDGEARGVVDLVAWQVDLSGKLKLAQNVLTQLLAAKVRMAEEVPFQVKGSLDSPKVTLAPGGGEGGTGIRPLDRLLDKKGAGDVLRQILPGVPQQPAPREDQPQPQPPSTAPAQPRPQDLLKDLFKIR